MNAERPDGALLAGVCAGIARALNWNVWVLRVLFIGFLIIKSFLAVLIYAGLALLFYLAGNDWGMKEKSSGGLASPELSRRNERIDELERRFRDLEETDK